MKWLWILVLSTGGLMAQSGTRTFESPTIRVQLVQGDRGTEVYLTEHGNADQVLVQAFYHVTFGQQRLMLYKEASTFVRKGITTGTDLPLRIEDIEFIQVKEMKTLRDTRFPPEVR